MHFLSLRARLSPTTLGRWLSRMDWRGWAVAEGGIFRMLSFITLKGVGVSMKTPETGFPATVVISFVQMMLGLLWFFARAQLRTHRKKPRGHERLIPDRRSIAAAIGFAFFATVMTVNGVVTFSLGADLSIRTLLTACSIVPGTFLGCFLFKDPFSARQGLGIGIFLLAAWSMVDFPDIEGILALPLWVPLMLISTVASAFNEVLARKMGVKLDAPVSNFLIGGASIVFSFVGLAGWVLLAGKVTLALDGTLLWGSTAVGFITVGLIASKLLSLKGDEVAIGLKQLLMWGSLLMSVTFAGALIYGEPVTVGKIVGIVLFPIAYALTDNKAWGIVRNRLKSF